MHLVAQLVERSLTPVDFVLDVGNKMVLYIFRTETMCNSLQKKKWFKQRQ